MSRRNGIPTVGRTGSLTFIVRETSCSKKIETKLENIDLKREIARSMQLTALTEIEVLPIQSLS